MIFKGPVGFFFFLRKPGIKGGPLTVLRTNDRGSSLIVTVSHDIIKCKI